MTPIQTLTRLLRRIDGMGLERGDCTSDLSLLHSDAVQTLRLLGYAWNWSEQIAVTLPTTQEDPPLWIPKEKGTPVPWASEE